jgi:prevent-host-death family protein
MHLLRASKSTVTISDFTAQSSEWLRHVGESGQPLVITQNGKAAGVLLSPQAFGELMVRAHFVAAVEEGLADTEAGRVHLQSAVAAEMKKRFRGPSQK